MARRQLPTYVLCRVGGEIWNARPDSLLSGPHPWEQHRVVLALHQWRTVAVVQWQWQWYSGSGSDTVAVIQWLWYSGGQWRTCYIGISTYGQQIR
jgi:hypothetical protein